MEQQLLKCFQSDFTLADIVSRLMREFGISEKCAFAIFYYLFSFRKKLKEFEFESNNPNKQTNYYQDNQETTYSENTSAY